MQYIRNSLLNHVRVKTYFHSKDVNTVNTLIRHMSITSNTTSDQISARVIGLVKKFSNIDATKVTETANFQKDLSLDSLDRVELVMALEQEFSIEIPDDEADNLTCCADVANYILSETRDKLKENP